VKKSIILFLFIALSTTVYFIEKPNTINAYTDSGCPSADVYCFKHGDYCYIKAEFCLHPDDCDGDGETWDFYYGTDPNPSSYSSPIHLTHTQPCIDNCYFWEGSSGAVDCDTTYYWQLYCSNSVVAEFSDTVYCPAE